MKKTFALATFVVAVSAGGLAGGVAVASENEETNELPIVSVYQSPGCGCCDEWIDHLEENGFTVEVNNTHNIEAVKEGFGVPPEMTSCHTAFVGDYFVEGHVPADEIKGLLSSYPDVRGIAVQNMLDSPGESYEVISVGINGEVGVRSIVDH
ncbi:MAG: DUF411 domain-containing protein [Halomonadaceae bacterium]|nr:DUF411 domain-containing protein [Halomonadaceae bacterium]